MCCIADDVLTYKVRTMKTVQTKIIHRTRLLLWLADFEDKEGLKVNIIRLDDGMSPSTMLETPSLQDAESGVPPGLHYGLNLVSFGRSDESLASTMDLDVQGVTTRTPQNETSLEAIKLNSDKCVDTKNKDVGDILPPPADPAPKYN